MGKTVKPRARSAAAKVIEQEDETAPGDMIELGLTEEVRSSAGSRWVKVGLVSQHRPGETTAEATERIENFVVESLDAFIKATVR